MTKEDWKQLKKNIPNIVLFIFVCVIVCSGIHGLLFFVSESDIDAEGDDTNPRFLASLWIGFGIATLAFYLYFNKKKQLTILKDSFQILAYLHGETLWSKLPLDEFDKKKNLALGLTLEAKGIGERFDSNKKDKIFEDLSENESCDGWYRWLKELDELIQNNIEEWIKQHFPKKVYFIRLRLLEDYIQATKQGKYLAYDKSEGLPSEKVMIVKSEEELLASEEDIPSEFYKMILNKYHSEYEDVYPPQPFNFDHRLFRKHFTIEGAIWGFLREAYRLLSDAEECCVHRKSPPAIGELLSNISQMYENKEFANTDVAIILWNTYEALYKAHKIYEENLRDSPRDESYEIDFEEDKSLGINLENYADKELPSDAGEKMLPYLNEAENYLIEAETFLKISKEEMPRFWNSPPPISSPTTPTIKVS